MESKYEISAYSIEQAGRRGYLSIPVKVFGFWSSDPITIRVSHQYAAYWTYEISHSSGGRDTEQVECDADAEENFGNALKAAAAELRKIKAREPELEAAFQAAKAEAKAEYEKELQEAYERVAADPEMGAKEARKLVLKFKALDDVKLSVFNRGAVKPTFVEKKLSGYTGVITMWHGIRRTSFNELVKLVAEGSTRTSIICVQ